jgi:glycerol-3-phosphate dehydrogenase subunit B
MQDANINCELIVIGAGMAGMAAAAFAATEGIATVLVGMPNALRFASGLLDLMAVYPIAEQNPLENPWDAIRMLRRSVTKHPYSRMSDNDIRLSVEKFISFLGGAGIPYQFNPERNAFVMTSIGSVKPTFCVPRSMWNGLKALKDKTPALLIDFFGLKGFSAAQIKETMRDQWPALRIKRVAFPRISGDLYAETLAKELDSHTCRKLLAEEILPHIENAESLGFPSVVGLDRCQDTINDLERRIGLPIFEIPGLPPSVPGLRLRMAFEKELAGRGVLTLFQQEVLGTQWIQKDEFAFAIGHRNYQRLTVRAKGAILASGRFLGKGLYADRKSIRETIFDLPVFQPKDRTQWHNKQMFDPNGHAINQSGLEIDDEFRPLNESGQPAFKTLFAAGSILAHQDWVRMKCGAGLSIATAYKAVHSFMKQTKA